jgi:hypothetical protein
MKYQLLEEYFESPLLQKTTQLYFDTVLASLTQNLIESKGLFERKGKVVYDGYDMPYHIHILNGLIPMLHAYEYFIMQNKAEEDPNAETYLKVLILGFTFHDSNKLIQVDDLHLAMRKMDQLCLNFRVFEFFPAFERYKHDIFYLSLHTEKRTSVQANEYKVALNYQFVKDILARFCRMADALASLNEFSDIESTYEQVVKAFGKIKSLQPIQLSFIAIRPNPYTLLSQRLLQDARKVLLANGRKVCYATRQGFIFFGDDISKKEYEGVLARASIRGDDVDITASTKIDAGKCSFGFLGTVPFSSGVVDQLVDKMKDKFLLLSPNGREKINDYDTFIGLLEATVEGTGFPIKVDSTSVEDKVYLRFIEEFDADDEIIQATIRLFCLTKIKWLNSRGNKQWESEYKACLDEDTPLPFELETNDIVLGTYRDVSTFLASKTASPSPIFKTLFAIIKSYQEISEAEDFNELVETVEKEVILNFDLGDSSLYDPVDELASKYLFARNMVSIEAVNAYSPEIPEKSSMCAFTGTKGSIEYKEAVAFGMKARGFSNRTRTSLGNNISHVSALFAEENKLRASAFPKSRDANTVTYYDFHEVNLDISRDVVESFIKNKNSVKILESKNGMEVVEFDKNVKFYYNLYNLQFEKIPADIESAFFFVRRQLLLAKQMGIRTYVAGTMSKYEPHKEIFHFANAPKYLQKLGWDRVRLVNIEKVLAEIKLIILFGKGRLAGNLLKISESRTAYFKLYYLLQDEDKKKIFTALKAFIKENQHINEVNMTVTDKLVHQAMEIQLGFQSGSDETWLIRTALDFMRKNVKYGLGREDTIQQIGGNIYKTLRKDRPDEVAIQEFATSVYDLLYVEQWKKSLPSVNRQKDWIYQFGFQMKIKSQEKLDQKKAQKIKTQLQEKDLEITLENVAELLKEGGKGAEKYAPKYFDLITKQKQ